MDSKVVGLFQENCFIKHNAAVYGKSGSKEDRENLLMQLVIHMKLDPCGAPTPMVDTGVIMFIASWVDEEGKQWMPLYTDLDEVFDGNPTAYTVEVPIRNLVEEAFEKGMYEGIIINPYSDKVRLDKNDLDYVLDTLMQIEAKQAV